MDSNYFPVEPSNLEPWEAAGVAEGEVGAHKVFACLLFLQIVTLTVKASPG